MVQLSESLACVVESQGDNLCKMVVNWLFISFQANRLKLARKFSQFAITGIDECLG